MKAILDQTLKYEPRIVYPAKLSFKYQGYRKTVSNMEECKEHGTH